MEKSVVRDISALPDAPVRVVAAPEPTVDLAGPTTRHTWAARQFHVDPASSPHLMAAFAWAAPRG